MTLQESSAARGALGNHYDAVIVGGSFAGLAVATQLKGRRVLLIDQRRIGSHQTSTCAMPLATATASGTLASVQEVHTALTLHTGGREIVYNLSEPYVTFDYHAFCQAMLANTDAEVWLAKATGYDDGAVETTRGRVSADFVVDASGWQSLVRPGPSRNIPLLGYGVETELPVRLEVAPGLHFYYEKRIARSGYGWVFHCGESVRVGVCSFDRGVSLGPVLDAFLARFGLTRGTTHGGAMPVVLREPLRGDLLVVGDAAGQCMPLWAEGIRSSMYHSLECGKAIADALDGTISHNEARQRYASLVYHRAGFHGFMLHLQKAVAVMPEWLRAGLLSPMSWPPVARRVVGIYLQSSGWIQDARPVEAKSHI